MAGQEDPTALHSPLRGLPRGVQGLSSHTLHPYVPGSPACCVIPSNSTQVYAVATSTNTPCTRIPRMTGEEKEFEAIERGA